MPDIKPVFKYTNGDWEKQEAYQYTSGSWVQISSKDSPVPPGPTPSQGIVYTLSEDETYYIVGTGFNNISNIGPDTDYSVSGTGLDNTWLGGDLVIPSTYNGKPVLAIAPRAFDGINTIDNIYVYDGITTLGVHAFSYRGQSYYGLNPSDQRLKTVRLPSTLTKIPNASLFFGRGNLNKVEFHPTNPIINGSYKEWFRYCRYTQVLDMSDFELSNITNLYGTFWDCSSIIELDLSHWYTNNVTAMDELFENCTSLQRLDIRNFDFTNVTSCGNMLGSQSPWIVPSNCLIIVKDDTAKNFITSRFPRMTNVQTVAEYEANLNS